MMNKRDSRRGQRGISLLLSLLIVLSVLMTFPATAVAEETISDVSIKNVPLSAVAGESLDLTVAVVTPEDVTVTWDINTDETTADSASLVDGILATMGAGTIVVTATIADGLSEGTLYVENFTIMVTDRAPFPVTAVAGESLNLSNAAVPLGEAANSEISWSIAGPETTDATINENVFDKPTPGKVIIRATAAAETAEGQDAQKEFTLLVANPESAQQHTLAEGSPTEWSGSGAATFTANADSMGFCFLTLNGQEVPPGFYMVSSDGATPGGTVISLTEEYLKRLPAGAYTFRAEFTGGFAPLPLNIISPATSPEASPETIPETSPSATDALLRGSSGQSRAATAVPYATAFKMLTDGDTSERYETLFGNTSGDDGRVWTDKTVGMGTDADEFSVTLSALAQAVQVPQIAEVPTDTVFILDVSTSMTQKMDSGNSRITEMVDALNDVIYRLMQDNDENRVAVVAFGGAASPAQRARGEGVLQLGRYTVTDGPDADNIPDDYFFTPSGGIVEVDDEIPADMLHPDSADRRVPVKGGTATQWGIYEAAQIFFDVEEEDTEDSEGNIRKPNFVLLTDGEPTFGWQDYAFLTAAPTLDNFTSGNANIVDMGPEILTVLSAAYFKQRVSEHYYSQSPEKAGFYTIGLGVGDSDDAKATMNPGGKVNESDPADERINADRIRYSLDSTGLTYNMREVLDSFVRAGTTQFPTLTKLNTGSGQRDHRLETVDNTHERLLAPLTSYNYADYYGEAESADDLQDQFDSVTSILTTHSNYATSVISDPAGMYEANHTSYADYSGAVVFSDVIGEYMEFKSFDSLRYHDVPYNGAAFANHMTQENPGKRLAASQGPTTFKAINTVFASQLFFTNATTATSGTMTEAQLQRTVEALVSSCLAAKDSGGNPDNAGIYYNSATDFGNRIRYYAKGDSTWVGNYFTADGEPAGEDSVEGEDCVVDMYFVSGGTTNNVSGNPSDLIYSVVQVITALKDTSVTEVNFDVKDSNHIQPHLVDTRALAAGQQMVRWIIPASLLPLRSVMSGQTPVVTEADPIRFMYSVGLKSDFSLDDPTLPAYVAANGYHFYANAWKDTNEQALAHFIPGPENPYYSGGSPPADIEVSISKGTNTTQTNANVTERRAGVAGPMQAYTLGNNGVLEVPFGELTVTKQWSDELETLGLRKTEWVQLYLDGAEVRSPLEMDPTVNNLATQSWPALPLFAFGADESGNAIPLAYTVTEGYLHQSNNDEFVAYTGTNAGFKIDYFQPTLNNDGDGYEATIQNSPMGDKNWIVDIKKNFTLNGDPLPQGEVDALLRNQAGEEVTFMLFAKVLYDFDTNTVDEYNVPIYIQCPIGELGGGKYNRPIQYPDVFSGGHRAMWFSGATSDPDAVTYMLVEFIDPSKSIGDYQCAPEPVTFTGVAGTPIRETEFRASLAMAVNIDSQGNPLYVDTNAPLADTDLPQDALMPVIFPDGYVPGDTEEAISASVLKAYAYEIPISSGNTGTFEITNNLTPKVKPVANLTLDKSLEGGIDQSNFSARFIVEGWESKNDMETRTLENRVYYQSIDYADLSEPLEGLPVPADSSSTYYYTVTEMAAGSIRQDAMSLFSRAELVGSSSGPNLTVEDAGEDMVGFPLGAGNKDATLTLHLNNAYTRLMEPGEITLEKQLAGNASTWGVTDNTPFRARVQNLDTEEYLVFDENNVLSGYTLDAAFNVAFSAGGSAVLKNIPLGKYRVEEQSSSGYTAEYVVGATATNEVELVQDTSESATITITNTFSGSPPPGGDDDPPGDSGGPPEDGIVSPATGDDNDGGLWLALLLFSALGVVLTLKWRQTQRKKGRW